MRCGGVRGTMFTMNPIDDEQTQATWGAVDVSSVEDAPWGEQRYEDLGHLARGGMGEVRRVRDRFLRRVVVRKTLLSSHCLLYTSPSPRD